MTCPKCGERERAKGQRWCRECRNVSRRKVDTTDTRTDTDGHVSIELKDTLGGVSIPIPKRVGVCPNCQVLADDVKRLKRDLAAAHEELETLKGGGAHLPHRGADSNAGRGVRMAARPDNDKQYTAHGARCMCQWCQQQRRVAALEGA